MFYGLLKKFIFWNVFYIEAIVNPFLIFVNSFTQKFHCLLYAGLVASAFSFLYLFNNLERFIIAFCKFLFINLAWLYLTYLFLKGTFFSNIILEIPVNRAKSSDYMLLEDNSIINSPLNSLLLNCMESLYLMIHFWKYVLRKVKVNLWKSDIPVS